MRDCGQQSFNFLSSGYSSPASSVTSSGCTSSSEVSSELLDSYFIEEQSSSLDNIDTYHGGGRSHRESSTSTVSLPRPQVPPPAIIVMQPTNYMSVKAPSSPVEKPAAAPLSRMDSLEIWNEVVSDLEVADFLLDADIF